MTGFLRSIGFISDEPTHVPAAVAPLTDETAGPPLAVDLRSGGRDSEPEHLRKLRVACEQAEVARDLAHAAYTYALARYSDQRPTWAAE